jgi:hypothetical protein
MKNWLAGVITILQKISTYPVKISFFSNFAKKIVKFAYWAFLKDIKAFFDKIFVNFGSQFFKSSQMSIITSGFPEM